MDSNPLTTLSPLDGRYQEKVGDLSNYFSELALQKYRVMVEIEWLIFLCNTAKLQNTRKLTPAETKMLRNLYLGFSLRDGECIKALEKTTNHDVKAIEYFIQRHLKGSKLETLETFIHFGCTSEDINNLSYALMIRDGGKAEVMTLLAQLLKTIFDLAKKYKSAAMLSRTHGQTASPTTMGKELINVVRRLEMEVAAIDRVPILGKINGAVGNYSAHTIAYPNVKWEKLGRKFVEGLGLQENPFTTQIEPHDYMAELFHALSRINTILIDFSRDIWMYTSREFFKQKIVKGEIGSSTMPHKVNPIDFENAEGNFGIANSLFLHMANKLPISRMQRDLSDSTVQRNIGVAMGYSVLGYKSLLKGLGKLEINEKAMLKDLNNNWEVLAEAVQTVLRKHKIKNAYERLKKLTRGKRLTATAYKKFVQSLPLPKNEKERLKKLTPATYTGLAEKLTEEFKI